MSTLKSKMTDLFFNQKIIYINSQKRIVSCRLLTISQLSSHLHHQ